MSTRQWSCGTSGVTFEVKYIPYSRYYKPPLYLFLRLFGASSRPRTRFFLASLEFLVRLLFKRGLYSRAAYNSENTVDISILFYTVFSLLYDALEYKTLLNRRRTKSSKDARKKRVLGLED